ncbi:MAG: DODA-type extradiol aromatic ring-opening family dioxygenase, partial [Panacagrimonas sp.]
MTNAPTLPRSLFLGHGAPTLATSAHPATDAMRALGSRLGKPRAAIVVSPHREAAVFAPGTAPRFTAWHDFRGFPRELYELRYAPPGDPDLAGRIQHTLSAAGLAAQVSDDARIDHGIWVPLRLIWPHADVPVVPIAQTGAGPAAHLALGRALRPLIEDGCLVIGSGSITHNLGDLDFQNEYAEPSQWAREFDDWIAQRLAAGDHEALVDYRARAPHATYAHPTEEHL